MFESEGNSNTQWKLLRNISYTNNASPTFKNCCTRKFTTTTEIKIKKPELELDVQEFSVKEVFHFFNVSLKKNSNFDSFDGE